jgi:N-acetylglucosaminyldiphosphoundecaprenol N-acetyl-beta-D-mannosaminyltransferase
MRGHETESPRALPTVDLLGIPFHSVTERECVEHILRESRVGRGGWVVTPNLDIVRMLAASRDLRWLFRGADLVLADGMPIVWASRILGRPVPERVAGSSLVSTLSAGAARAGRSVYLLGGDPGTAQAAATELRRRHPDLRIAGVECPSYGFEADSAAVARIGAGIAACSPDIVFVALGCPKQERLIERIRGAAPRAWYLGVGISFSYLAGAVRRAPAWVRRSGLEWAFRLVQEPRRLVRRYLRDDLPFAGRLAALSIWGRIVALLPFGLRAPRLVPVEFATPRETSPREPPQRAEDGAD